MASVILENVSRVFANGVRAVDRLSLTANDKELLVLLGPSGCGKSTTLRLIAGLEQPSQGGIRIGGRLVAGVPPKDRDIAMVFQSHALYPHLSVYGNMAFGLEMRRGARWTQRLDRLIFRRRKIADNGDEITERVRRTARILGIEHLLERMPRQLSGGERQRVALGRAMVRRPAVFLFDEPLSNLDAKLRVETRRELKALHNRLAVTTIYVTHDQLEALSLGQRVAVLDGGVLQQVGTPQQVYEQPRNRFVASFIGSPSMNFFSGNLLPTEQGVAFQGTSWPLRIHECLPLKSLGQWTERSVELGIRPQDLTINAGGETAGAFEAQVSVIEFTGDSTLVTVTPAAKDVERRQHKMGELNVVIKTQPSTELRIGEIVSVGFFSDRIYFFDSQTGERLPDGSDVEGVPHSAYGSKEASIAEG